MWTALTFFSSVIALVPKLVVFSERSIWITVDLVLQEGCACPALGPLPHDETPGAKMLASKQYL